MDNDRNGGDNAATDLYPEHDTMINSIVGVELWDHHNEDIVTREEMARSQYSGETISTLLAKFAPWLEEDRPLLPHQEAAILLEYARDGQDLNGSKLTLRSRLCYRLRHKFQWVFRIAAWGLVLVHIFERPAWTYKASAQEHWNDFSMYPSFGLPYLPSVVVVVLEVAFLLTLWMAVGMGFGYKLGTNYSYLPYITGTILLVKSGAVLSNIIQLSLGLNPSHTLSPVEAPMCLLVELQYDNNIGYLVRTIPKFGVLMFALAVAVCSYTALGFLVIDPSTQEAQEYFPSFGAGVWTMLTVLNGSNWPGPMIPAFRQNRAYCVYFFVYIVMVNWGLLNLVLGFNYLFFQQEQRGILDMQELTRLNNLAEAFRIMDVEKKGFLTYAQVDDLLQEMYEFYEEMRDGPTAAERYELILVLDIQSNLMIDENDFSYIEQKCFQGALRMLRAKKRKFTRYVSANIIRNQARQLRALPSVSSKEDLEMVRTRRNSIIEHASAYAGKISDPKLLDLYRSIETKQYLSLHGKHRPTLSQWLAFYAMQVDTIYFDILTDSVILAVGISLLLHSHAEGLVYAYITLCLIEMVLKWAVKGTYRYSRSSRNVWDGGIAMVLLITAIIEASAHTRPGYVHIVTKTLVLLRILLFPRNILVTNGFKAFRSRHRLAFHQAFRSAGHFSFLMLVLAIMLYVFAGIGQDIFGGGICHGCADTALIEDSLYGQSDYWPLNFNDMPSGMVTMFTLLTVNNMHVTASGFTAAYSQWAEVFFACWYALGVLLLLNVLTAVFLDQFTGYMSQLALERQHAEEEKAQAEEQLMREIVDARDILNQADAGAGKDDEYFNQQSISAMCAPLQRNGDPLTVDTALGQKHMSPQYPPRMPRLGLRSISLRSHYSQRSDDSAHSPSRFPGRQLSSPNLHRNEGSRGGFSKIVKLLAVDDTVEVPPDNSTLLSYRQDSMRSILPKIARHADSMPSIHRSRSSDEAAPDTPRQKVGGAFSGLSRSRRGSPPSTPTATEAATTGPGRGRETTGMLPLSVRRRARSIEDARPSSVSMVGGARQRSASVQQNSSYSSNSPMPRRLSTATERMQAFSIAEHDFRWSAPVNYADPPGPILRRESLTPHVPLSATDRMRAFTSANMRASTRSTGPGILDQLASGGRALHSRSGSFFIRSDEDEDDTASGFEPSIFANNTVRQRLANWVNSQQPGSEAMRLRTGSDAGSLGYSAETPSDPFLSAGYCASESIEEKSTSNSEEQADFNANGLAQQRRECGRIRRFSYGNFMSNRTPPTPVIETRPISTDFTLAPELTSASAMSAKFLSWWEILRGNGQLTSIERAAMLVLFAKEGHEHSMFLTPRALLCFRLRTALNVWLKGASVLLVLVKFFHRPLWTYRYSHWEDNALFPSSGFPQLPATITGAVKLPILLFLLLGLLLELVYNDFHWGQFLATLTKMRAGRYVLFCFGLAQVALIVASLGGGPEELVPITSCGGMLYVLWFNRPALRKLQVVLEVVPRLSIVLLGALLLLFAFAGFGPYLFNIESVGVDDDLNQEYFGTFGSATWSIFVAVTSSNYPNQILPAYRDDRTFFLYFFAFMLIGAFILLNLILVIVFVEFQKASQLAADIQRASRQVLLMRAFNVLDPTGAGHIEREQVRLLLDELYMHYAAFQSLGPCDAPARSIMVEILDVDYDGKITVSDFLFFLDVTKIRLRSAQRQTFMEALLPGVQQCGVFQTLLRTVEWRYFGFLLDSVLVLLIVLRLCTSAGQIYAHDATSINISWSIVAVMLLELGSRLLVHGGSGYWASYRNRLDFVTTTSSFIGIVGLASYNRTETVSGFNILLRVAIMCRLLMYPRNARYLIDNSGLRRFTRLLRRVLQQTVTLGMVFLCITYLFASIGLFAFGGAINKTPSDPHYDALMGSRYGVAGYFGLNFNDFLSAWFTLCSCIHVSDFDLVASGFTATTVPAAKLYFALWYVVGVLLMLNILKSFFLGEFLALFLVSPSQEAEEKVRKMSGERDRQLAEEEDSQLRPARSDSNPQSGRGNDYVSEMGSPSSTSSTVAVMAAANKPRRYLSWAGDLPGGDADSTAAVLDGNSNQSPGKRTKSGLPPLLPAPVNIASAHSSKKVLLGVGGGNAEEDAGRGGVHRVISKRDLLNEDLVPLPISLSSEKLSGIALGGRGGSADTVFFASTEKVKNLDEREWQVLKRRIDHLGTAV